MKHVRRISVPKAQDIEITDPSAEGVGLGFWVWIASVVWFAKEWQS